MDATRLITLDDAPALARLVQANQDFLAPYEPSRGDGYLTGPGQRAAIGAALDHYRQGTILPHVILGEAGEIAGQITLNDIVRGAFQSGHLGYWVSGTQNGRGLATAAVRHITELAFGPLGLHRIQAATLLDNTRSQRVLERTGFTRCGVAPDYLHIAGKWQDHALYQLVTTSRG